MEFVDECVNVDGVKSLAHVKGDHDCSVWWFVLIEPLTDGVVDVV